MIIKRYGLTSLPLIMSISGLFVAWLMWRTVMPPLLPFPKPTGPYALGTMHYQWPDASRHEPHSDDTTQKRELLVRIWYPTESTTAPLLPYATNLAKPLAEKTHLPLWLWQHELARNTSAHINAPALQSRPWPVVIFSHGSGTSPEHYAVYIEDLVSHGFVVVSINHPYLADISVLSDGRVITSANSKHAFTLADQLKIWVADIRFVIEQIILLQKNTSDIWHDKFDLERIGVWGHSMGGTAAIEVCRQDAHCKVAMNMDGWITKIIATDAFDKPIMFLMGEEGLFGSNIPTDEELKEMRSTVDEWKDAAYLGNQEIDTLCSAMRTYCTKVIVPQARHIDFSDIILLKKPLQRLLLPSYYQTRVRDIAPTITSIRKHVHDFFSYNLTVAESLK